MKLDGMINAGRLEKFASAHVNPEAVKWEIAKLVSETACVSGVYANEKYMVVARGPVASFYNTDDILWVFPHSTSLRLYGAIPVGRTNNVLMKTADGELINLPMATKESAGNLIKFLFSRMPNAVFGYTDELNRVFSEQGGATGTWTMLAKLQHGA